ncbi:Variant surface glycoprotein [Trypanosoma congolense IL3000]|uniref:Variant surface glycoprotein n=1 Tax=Trypanosoma congolense (strain IL3000) TaxID=1068625 RepID=F9W7A5_TRYCI|nr:Variant surface glycoprotein [Trypanosoma congolense IL3000]
MTVLLGIRMKALVLGMVVVLSVVMSLGSGHNEDAFKVLCDVLRSTERLLSTNTISEPSKSVLEEALYGKSGRILTVKNGMVSVNRNSICQTNRGLLCTFYGGGARNYGCFAESLAGTLLCTCTPGQSGGSKGFCGLENFQNADAWTVGGRTPLEQKENLFQKVWDNVIKKCSHGNGNVHSTEDKVGDLETAVQKVRGTLKQGPRGKNNFFYLGEPVGCNGCSGSNPRDVCAAYHTGRTNDKHTVHIPWANTIENALSDLKKALKPKAPETVSVPATLAASATTTTETQTIFPTKPSDPSTTTNTTEQGNTEDGHHTETEAPAHQSSPKSRSKRSTAESPTATSTATEDTSTIGEPEILDPTAAPFPLADGADILTPLGLFMAASSFF